MKHLLQLRPEQNLSQSGRGGGKKAGKLLLIPHFPTTESKKGACYPPLKIKALISLTDEAVASFLQGAPERGSTEH